MNEVRTAVPTSAAIRGAGSAAPAANGASISPPAPASRTAASTQPTRWLDADQQRHWRSFQIGSTMLRDALDRQLEEDSDLSLAEYEVLVRLSEAPHRALRMSDLADGLAHSRSRLSHTIARMEKDGLVARSRCPSDARGVLATMTDHGWDVVQEAAHGHVRAVRTHLVDVLTPAQLAALGAAMDVVADHLMASGT